MKLTNINYNQPVQRSKPSHFRIAWVLVTLLLTLSLVFPMVRDGLAQAPEAAETPQAFWNLSTVEDSMTFIDMTDRSARFDVGGNAHIAFGGDHLYYARWEASNNTWITRVVDSSPNVGSHASIAVDNQGNPRIAYYDGTNGTLKFAFSQDRGFTWNFPVTVDLPNPSSLPAPAPEGPFFEDVLRQNLRSYPWGDRRLQEESAAGPDTAQADGVGKYTSIAVDSQNRVHISYYDSVERGLKYARWDGVNWFIETVDSNPADFGYDVGRYSSIAVDSINRPHISYMDEKYDGLKYAYNYGGGWELQEIDSRQAPNFRFGGFTSLILDKNDNPHISYQEWENLELKYATLSSNGNCGPGNSWVCRVVDNSENTGWYSSIAITSSGERMISYYNGKYGYLEFTNSTNGRDWNLYTIYADGDSGQYSSITTNPSGYPGVSFYSAGTGKMSFMRWNGSNWITTHLLTAGELGPYPSLGISPFNVPFIGYFNDIGDIFKLASNVNSGWYGTVLKEGVGTYSSTKINSAGDPRIALYDFTKGDLVFAYASGGAWYFQTVDSTNDVGLYPSLALDSFGRPYISYYDATIKSLKFAYWNGSAWVVQFVESSSADVGAYSSLSLSQNAANCLSTLQGVCPFISYYDATNQNLKAAFLSVINAWVPQVVDETGDVGRFSSIGVDSFGTLHISYYDATNGWLKHAAGAKGGTEWNWYLKEVVDNAGNVGQYTSLAVDAANQVHVSYYDVSQGNLKYALHNGAIWSKEVVDSAGDTGIGTSLGLFPNGQPAIAYYDASEGAIRFATQFSGIYGRFTYLPYVRR